MAKKDSIRHHALQTAQLFVENAVTNNIVLIQAMGLCPIIAAGTSLRSGVALTVCTAAVLIPLSLFIAFFANKMPKWLRPAMCIALASLLLIGAAFLMETYVSSELYAKLYLFIPLLAVDMLHNRSISMSSVVTPGAIVVDALGSTVGFGIVICLISALREMAINGTLWEKPIGMTMTLPEAAVPFTAFILLGFMAALLQWSRQRISAYFRKKEEAQDE